MSEASCFHDLKSGGIARELAPGVNARIFPGVNTMLSVVTLEPGSVSPVHSHPNEQWGVCLEGEWIRIQAGVEHHVPGRPPVFPQPAGRSSSHAIDLR